MAGKWIINHTRAFIFIFVSTMAITSCSDTVTIQPGSEQMLALNSQQASTTVAPPPIVNNKHVTLTNLNMENQGNLLTIKPGRTIHAIMNYSYHCTDCSAGSNNQIIVGLAGRSAQACIYNGGVQGQGSADFALKVPAKPGKYDVRFRGVQAMDCTEALKAGWNADNSPSKETTIGKIIVTRKAPA